MATKEEVEFLYDLERLLVTRRIEKPKGSYSTKLFKKGIDKIAQKLGEEAVETIIAAKNKKDAELIGETADLIYHMLVLLVEKEIPLDRVIQEMMLRSKK
ncbi:MAG: phosphoribosyl-ATP diphosphatase [Bacteroidetes bacterium]|jgi:phosphoribosyl-ATP pyrophosphohydrolase/phosphoribosyl-AMP cyclohydrolase|uniref:Phosphoribosyl-ATP pyrophosphatase n=1 Tax=Rhodohalobacter sulfatireducens TaxID=2911366 RepID=A0ABS9KCP5_9BACT|nr:phosphoribosyl-ATP diphosphatase [Rhodohalobacter sulfatireducens]MDR9363834.1 phosphoribosyl-ATP diphosphatase [Balneolaceae bacterium]NBC05319.1 phosphoribosyl-ATP diphosphatase [Bacteroidota bacterium]MCG2588625.1 phosphoribosyl-ATP diphosphatase [Rhodohalobacter sulfatireducens]MDR9408120.1 phosphoribosyl-ATP diphosphatase [Balneolaceae bacterium]NBC64669.1 phosphoribosyl-ATP diphosphatase [Bacteroidota bacterium]